MMGRAPSLPVPRRSRVHRLQPRSMSTSKLSIAARMRRCARPHLVKTAFTWPYMLHDQAALGCRELPCLLAQLGTRDAASATTRVPGARGVDRDSYRIRLQGCWKHTHELCCAATCAQDIAASCRTTQGTVFNAGVRWQAYLQR